MSRAEVIEELQRLDAASPTPLGATELPNNL